MGETTILIVDDEEVLLSNIKDYFEDYSLTLISDPRQALEELKARPRDIVIADYKMPGMTGIELLIEARKLELYTYGILFTAYADKEVLESALNENIVSQFIEKPLKLKQFKETVDKAVEICGKIKQKEEKIKNYEKLMEKQQRETKEIIGLKGGLKEVYTQVCSVAHHPVSVLLTGETGTGKEVIARLIHNMSDRKEHPFVPINCAAIPENLLESELFGYRKGAFSGAEKDKPGKLELAEGGTVFLDEIGEMRPDLQVKLLRVLQEKKVERLGELKSRRVDFRLIAATNKNLLQAIENKEFREDLYYRINTFPIHLPSLKQRKEDIAPLVKFYATRYAGEMNLKPPHFSRQALEALEEYTWRGNVRELINAVQRALIVSSAKQTVDPEDFGFLYHQIPEPAEQGKTLIEKIRDAVLEKQLDFRDLEKLVLEAILDHCQQNISRASKITGISRAKFYRMKEDEQL